MSAAVIVPTLNAGSVWVDWINALLATGTNVNDVYIIDSGSSDNTVMLSSNAGFNIRKIEPGTFNHGGTRQLAVTNLTSYDLVVFLTQDAVLCDLDSIQKLLKPFGDNRIGAVCGRQLPNLNAGVIEAHARLFNYTEASSIHSIKDASEKGLKVAFLSNSFAAYRVSALLDVGGFPKNVIFGEDMYIAGKMLKAGYKLAYAADACVYHSHNYSLMQEFKRYFDMGVFHAMEPWIRRDLGSAESEGKRFVISEMRYLSKNAFWRMPEGLLRTVLKYLGFRLGLLEKRLPDVLKVKLSMSPGFFSQKT
jgi:rhamnosyltransferase